MFILIGSGIAALLPSTAATRNNPGAHGLSEVLYNYASAGGNNGSAFAGVGCDAPFLNTSLGLVMLFVRFVPMLAAIAIAGSMAAKKKVAQSAGTLSTCNAMFVFLLILIVLIVGALSFSPPSVWSPSRSLPKCWAWAKEDRCQPCLRIKTPSPRRI